MPDPNPPRPAGDVVEDGVPATEEVRDEVLRTGDTGVADMPMPDRPWAVTDRGTTEREGREGESLGSRLAREVPDVGEQGGAGGRVLEPGADDFVDVEDDTVGEIDPRRSDSLSAEEAAMTVRDD
ncbi:MAG: hypothetical protein ACRDSE_24815, partial [Pseudonocardiaceae bacterium]